MKVVPLLEPLPRVLIRSRRRTEAIEYPRGQVEEKTIKEKGTNRQHDRSYDVIDDLHVDHRATIVLPAANILKEQMMNDGAKIT